MTAKMVTLGSFPQSLKSHEASSFTLQKEELQHLLKTKTREV